jgi:hypothetical protein
MYILWCWCWPIMMVSFCIGLGNGSNHKNIVTNCCEIWFWSSIIFSWDDDDICILLDQHTGTQLDLYSASSLQQQSMGKNIAPLWHIIFILIRSQPVFALNYSIMLCAQRRSNKYQFNNGLWFDPTRVLTQDLPR